MTMLPLRWLRACALALALGCSLATPAAPRVVLVQPSGSTVPANLLRFSVRFDAPVAGPVLARLALLRRNGSRIAEPFLKQELWSADGRVLTVLMHPGRVKTGLKAREDLGPILSVGDEVTLEFDGRPIKHWQTTAEDHKGPTPLAWTLAPVHAGSRQPLVVSLDEAVDGLDVDYLAVADEHGRRVAGRARLGSAERTWIFRPNEPWRIAAYKLVARPTLEDPAGNRLGSRFEANLDDAFALPIDRAISFDVTR